MKIEECPTGARTYRDCDNLFQMVDSMMFDDMVNPYTHGFLANYSYLPKNPQPPLFQAGKLLEDPTAPATDLLPKDIIINVWLYGPTDGMTAGLKSLEFFSSKGYTTAGMPYANLINAREWSMAAKHVKDEGQPCIGVIQTSWFGAFNSLEKSANTSWRVPKEP